MVMSVKFHDSFFDLRCPRRRPWYVRNPGRGALFAAAGLAYRYADKKAVSTPGMYIITGVFTAVTETGFVSIFS